MASSITAQGRDLTKTMNKVNEHYWYNLWHNDIELHTNVCIKNIQQIKPTDETSIYADTDSCFSGTELKIEKKLNGSIERKHISIQDWYNENIINGSAGETIKGHESVLTNDKILNWSEDNNAYYTPVKRIIRHKVSKQKWRLKTKSGKEIIVTNDHSMIVFRDGVKIEVKPSDILKTDKILVIKN